MLGDDLADGSPAPDQGATAGLHFSAGQVSAGRRQQSRASEYLSGSEPVDEDFAAVAGFDEVCALPAGEEKEAVRVVPLAEDDGGAANR